MSSTQAKDHAKKTADAVVHSAKADKAKGHSKEIIGSVKEKIGNVIGNETLEAEGYAQNAEGKKDRLKGEIKESFEEAKDKLKAGVELVKEKLHDVRKSH